MLIRERATLLFVAVSIVCGRRYISATFDSCSRHFLFSESSHRTTCFKNSLDDVLVTRDACLLSTIVWRLCSKKQFASYESRVRQGDV